MNYILMYWQLVLKPTLLVSDAPSPIGLHQDQYRTRASTTSLGAAIDVRADVLILFGKVLSWSFHKSLFAK